jgi:hypothetical protein
MQHAMGCQSIQIDVDQSQLTIERGAGVHTELHDPYIAACNRNRPWSTKAFVRTVCKIQHHDVVSPGIFAAKFRDKPDLEWTKQVYRLCRRQQSCILLRK